MHLDPWDADDLPDDSDDSDDSDDELDQPSGAASAEEAPTPGERLLFALGQLFRLSRRGQLDVSPEHFDVWDLAGIIGVRNDVEFISEDRRGSQWHFTDEVLHIDSDQPFPWRLLTIWEWAEEAEGNAFWAEDD